MFEMMLMCDPVVDPTGYADAFSVWLRYYVKTERFDRSIDPDAQIVNGSVRLHGDSFIESLRYASRLEEEALRATESIPLATCRLARADVASLPFERACRILSRMST